jgi:hypothetical protein
VDISISNANANESKSWKPLIHHLKGKKQKLHVTSDSSRLPPPMPTHPLDSHYSLPRPPPLIGPDHLPVKPLSTYKQGLKPASSHTLHRLMKMEPTQSSETSAFNTQTPRKYPEGYFSLLQHGESLKTTMSLFS